MADLDKNGNSSARSSLGARGAGSYPSRGGQFTKKRLNSHQCNILVAIGGASGGNRGAFRGKQNLMPTGQPGHV